jgi:energy-coupling factor transport system ATP-binding protein
MPKTPFAAEALHDITFSLERGSFTLLIGPSGSGKTTLIQHLNGLLKPTAGEVYFDGDRLGAKRTSLLALRRRIGLVFQMPEDQFFSETVYDEVAFAPRNLGFDEDKVEEKVIAAIKRVGLEQADLLTRHPFQLSAGQKRLVAFAAVLSVEPEVLILDEPAAGLDPIGKQKLFTLLTRLNQNEQLTVLVSTHHLDEIAALAENVLVLNRGRLIMFGKTEEVLTRRDELRALGLALPQVTEIMFELAAGGLPVSSNCYSLAAARDELKKLKRPEER